MAEHGHEHDTVKTEFVADDKITGPMGKIQGHAAKLANTFESLSSKVVGFAGLGGLLAGAFSLHKMIEDAEQYIGSVKQLQKVTGLSAEKTSGLMGAMRLVGIESEIANHMITRMAGKETMLGQMAENAKGLAGQMQQIGAATHDPITNLKAMAAAYQAHEKGAALIINGKKIASDKFDIVTMAKMAGIPVMMASKLQPLLKDGAKGIDDLFAKANRMGLVLTQHQIDGFTKLKKMQTEIKNTLLGLSIDILEKVEPALQATMEMGRDYIVKWVDNAKRFVDLLGGGIESAIHKMKALVSIVTVSGILTKLTGKGLVGTLAAGAAPGISAGGGVAGAGGAGIGGAVAGGGAALGAWAVIIYSIVGAFTSIWNNTLGVVDILKTAWSELETALEPVWAGIRTLLGPFAETLDGIRAFFADFFKGISIADAFAAVIPMTLGMIIEIFTQIVLVLRSAWTWIAENFKSWVGEVGKLFATIANGIIDLLNKIPGVNIAQRKSRFDDVPAGRSLGKVFDDLSRENEQLALARRMADSVKAGMAREEKADHARKAALAADAANKQKQHAAPGGKNYDFRGSHFTITQQFAEGFDPDRIAVTFAGGITALSDRRVEASTAGGY